MKLQDLPKREPFFAPEGYFDSLAERIEARKNVPQKAKFKIQPATYAIAASLALLLTVGLWMNMGQPLTNEPQDYLSEVSDEAIKEYLVTELELSHDDLVQYVGQEEIELEETILDGIETEELEKQLLEFENLEDYL
ncbi:MAG: hypothetical protein AAF740_02785 [Bacteroidota bacterium]